MNRSGGQTLRERIVDFAGDAAPAGDRGDRPWDASPFVLRAGGTTLVPMGATILRRASFPIR